MVRSIARIGIGTAALVLASGMLYAQTPPMKYDPAGETKVTATVVSVETREAPGGLDLLVLVDVAGEEVRVYAGPVAFVAGSNVFYQCKDELTIVGVRVRFENQPWILAREIAKDGKPLALRDEKGTPLWTSATEAK